MHHVRTPVLLALQSMFAETPTSASAALRPYRIVSALFAKPELCEHISASILLDMLKYLHRYMTGQAFSAEVMDNCECFVVTSFLVDSTCCYHAAVIEPRGCVAMCVVIFGRKHRSEKLTFSIGAGAHLVKKKIMLM